MSKLLIGIHGKPRSGKDTVADYLVSEYRLSKFGPSFPVKATAAAMFDVDINCFYDQSIKETIDPFWGISYREMAQKVGKESSRDVFGDDIWMRHVEKRLKDDTTNDRGIVLADIRYANEAEWVKAHGGTVLFVYRSSENRGYVANASHPAEQGLPETVADYIINNNSTLGMLYDKVDGLMREITK